MESTWEPIESFCLMNTSELLGDRELLGVGFRVWVLCSRGPGLVLR